MIGQKIKLQGHATAMRLLNAKAQRTKRGSEKRVVKLSFVGFPALQNTFIEEILNHEKTGGVRLGLFNRAVQILERKPNGGLVAVERDFMRADAVADFMSQDVRKEPIEAEIGLGRGR